MLTQELLTKLAALAKIEPKLLQDAISSTEEVAIEIPDLMTFTKTEIESRDNVKKGNGYADGKKAGLEMAVKEVKEEYQLEFEGKDLKSLIDNYGKKVLADAKIAPKEHEETITKLRATISEFEGKLTAKDNEVKAIALETEVLSLLPENAKGLSKKETLTLLKANGYDFTKEEGKLLVTKDGVKMVDDKLQTPIDATTAINSIYSEREWAGKSAATGRGGGSSNVTITHTKLSEVEKEWKDSGKSLNGEEYSAHIQSLVKADPAFDMNA